MLPTPSSPEIPTAFDETTPPPKRWALILSFVFSLVLVSGIVVVIAMSSNANASTYSLTGSGGNWTSPVSWSCTGTSAPGSTGCAGGFPGGGGVDGDVANISSGATVTVTSSVANAVTLTASGGTLQVAPGAQLNLVGISAVTSSAGLLIGGGTLNNTGTFTLSSLGTQTFDGGTLGGVGTTNVSSTFSITGTAGPMTISGQTVNNTGTINYSSPTNGLTVNGSIANGSVFTVSGAAPISGTGSIANTGTFSTTSTSTVGVTFNNSGSVTESVTGAKFSFTGGGTHTGTFNTGGTGGGFDFGGSHTFNAGSFTGGPVRNLAGGSWIVNTALTMAGAAFTNGGALSFGGAAQTISPSTFTQSGTGAFSPRLLANGVNDKLTVTAGTATLGGTLSPSLGYTPANGDSFVVLTSSADSGTMGYAPLTYPGGQIQASFNAASVSLAAVASQADLGITKTASSPTISHNQNVTFTVTVTNNGPSGASSVNVQDTVSGGTVVSATPSQGSCAGTAPVACSLGAMVNGGTATITVQVLGDTVGTMSNSATVANSPEIDSNGTNNTANASVTVNPVADLAITKSAAPNPVNAGASLVYTLTVSNSIGPDASGPITVTDTLPAGVAFVSAAGTGWTCSQSAGVVTCGGFASAPLAAGSAAPPITITVTAPSVAGTITNTATVSSGTSDPVPGNNTATTSTTVVTPQADLQITKSGPSQIPAGPLNFTITVKNLGPSDAFSVVVSDPTPAGTTFLGNSGDCTSNFPCSFSSIPAGATKVITASYSVSGTTTSVTNTATVSASTADPVGGNNSASATSVAGPTCPDVPTQVTPIPGATDAPTSGALQWTNVGATSYDVYYGPVGSGCGTLMGTTSATSFSYSGLTAGTSYESRIVANKASCSSQPSSCVKWTTAKPGCTLPAVTLVEPAVNATLASPVTFRWQRVPGAETYHVFASVNGASFTELGSTTETSLTTTLGDGPVIWYVVASAKNCGDSTSDKRAFNTCSASAAPQAGVVGAPTSGQPYAVSWDPVPGAVSYEVDEATNDAFTDAVLNVPSAASPTSVTFTHTTTKGALVFFYRVRAIGTCSAAPGANSRAIRVVILPPPANQKYPNFDIPAGTQNLVQLQIFIEGDPSGPVNFSIALDKPWMISVTPSSGVLPTAGLNVTLTVDPSKLPNGTFTGTLVVTTSPIATSNSRLEGNANTPRPVPVTVNLVTPIIPTAPTGPTPDTIIIPAVGRLTGINSQWRSDVRVFNGSSQSLKYQLDFLPSQASESKKTTISTAPGDTTALDDIIHNWYGFGEVGDSASGILQIRALTSTGSAPPSSALATVVSSRTYNNTPSQGTLGQFIPGIFFRNFVGRQTDASKAVAVLSLQQLAQTSSYRTNVGIVEGAGSPATVLLSILNAAGQKLTQDFSVSLKAGEQVALNQLLAQKGITANDARIEVRVTGGDGKVTAYASVVDNNSLDPLLVSPVILGQTSARTYVLPGVADLNTGSALWRSDLRILNGGNVPQAVDVLFYAQGNPANPVAASLTVNPGEVKVLDNVLASLFATTNAGGAVHVNTATDSQLVVTGRTFNQTGNGTLGQFIPAATLQDAIDRTTRGLNILQVEDSVRYRTNVGLAEMSGQSATVQVSVNLPDSKVTPTIQIPLAANEFRQFALRDLGLANIYNARVSISVISGNGKVTAYGSVIDMMTSDPTYVPAQ